MSINVQLHENAVPYLVSPYESFFFLIDGVKLTVESGNGYPGQGGCFFGREGRCYVSQYRIVFVTDPALPSAYRSFSLPFYCIREWQFRVSLLGYKTWRGLVNRVPGGGLVGVGRFTLEFQSHGFDEFRRHIEPLLDGSRGLFSQFENLTSPSVLLLPGKLPDPHEGKQRTAFFAPHDPMTIFIINRASA
ncbi:hypothetical protein P43SY_007193 [Pythium insidiosum]|uniref:GRAM domain-containing protein n=1 Tax=Pythium insidiosum TaxID=114742 RepID=A0AAD5Q573_PYTIN|nr:hypothetical protein P43SY_007193 [Pythium insidiosum]KAJ0401042.1 hypothetical protein ATCC90586_004147 [Pythium insidiosum]